MSVLLHHFTAWAYLPSIARYGLWKGDVPISRARGLNAVNLTTLSDSAGHGLEGLDGNALKKAVRLDIEVDPDVEPLQRWNDFARDELSKKWRRILESNRRSETWYLYWGIISPVRLTCFDVEAQRELDLKAYSAMPCSIDRPPPSLDPDKLRGHDVFRTHK